MHISLPVIDETKIVLAGVRGDAGGRREGDCDNVNVGDGIDGVGDGGAKTNRSSSCAPGSTCMPPEPYESDSFWSCNILRARESDGDGGGRRRRRR